MASTVITAMAMHTCLGRGFNRHLRALDSAESGLGFDHRFRHEIVSPLGEIAALTRFTGASWFFELAGSLISDLDQQSGFRRRYHSEQIGLVVGTSTFGVDEYLQSTSQQGDLGQFLAQLTERRQASALIEHLVQKFELYGLSYAVANACASGALAMGMAHQMIQQGVVDAVVVGGIDILNPITIHGFDGLQVLAKDISQPLSGQTIGMNLGEAGAFLLMERASIPSGLMIQGFATCSEGHHPTHPNSDGSGMARAMTMALDNAGCVPDDIDYVNGHGSGTPANDQAELLARERVFGARSLVYESTKSLTGHCLAAAGVVETVLTVARLSRQDRGRQLALNNSFGFGGTNVSLVLAKCGPSPWDGTLDGGPS